MLPAAPAAAPSQRYEMLQAGLDLLDQGITVFDGDLRLVAWNRTFLQLLEFPEKLAFVGAPFESFIRYNAERGEYGPGDREIQIAERVGAARDFAPHLTERQRPNGRVLMLRGEPLPHRGFVTLYSDVTEQRYIEHLTEHQNIQLEERVRRRTAQLENANANLRLANEDNERIAAALGRSEARLRLINDTIPILIGYVDKDEVYRYANKGYSDWYGHPEGSVTGRAVLDVIGPEVYGQVRDSVRRALAGQQVTYEYQMEKQGQTVFARSTLVPEISAAGETLGFFVFSHEITEQKRMQAALVQAQKMEAIGQLTGGLAHDFNNLLTVIIGNLAALQDHRPDDAGVNEFVEPALQSARRGVQLIKRLLTFSRQQPLEPQAVDIGRLIGSLAKLVRRSLPESIAVSTDLAGASIHALVDPGQLESALLNFALNSRDAMPNGGRLHIGARAVELSTDAAAFDVPPGHYVLIEVADNGCGMDAATLSRACEPFFTTKRFGLGSGLGLAMAYGFAKQSGGGVSIQSQPEQGTSVLMVLPLAAPELELDAPCAETALPHGGELVLLVEDEPNVRRVVRQQLIDLGYPVIEAEDGAQALDMIDQVHDIAIVVSDVIMPGGLNGRQLAEQTLARRPQMRIVLMSGYTDEADADATSDLPVLAKPFDRQDLARALQRAPRGKP
ncbi:PAS-domain containing protein [Ferribacterium limneticum]|uniref:PAS-domain containing protein n=1 Tax=Ferribacterium limneticum TaxID=76259 RepID=UPI001CFB4884|nr:PAS-domain containing protein [Ferribacterium limneticum]UCV28757.1 PAS-domain containing protein [Ferribacterium limneticum]UCV32674.1 PAS-domain containing protein [Ferribacterium limneticum]